MVVEVFLNMDEIYVMLRKELTDACRIGCFVPRHIVAVYTVWQSSNIERNRVEESCCLRASQLEDWKQRNDSAQR